MQKKRLSIRARLRLAGGVTVVLVVGIAGLVRSSVGQIADASDRFNTVTLMSSQALGELDAGVARVTGDVRGLSVPWLADRQDALRERLAVGLAAVRDSARRYDALEVSAGERAAWAELSQKVEGWAKTVETLAPLLQASTDEGGTLAQMQRVAVIAQLQRSSLEVERGVSALAAAGRQAAADGALQTKALAARAVSTLLVLLVVTALLSVLFQVLVARGVGRSLSSLTGELSRVSEAVADGRLGERGEVARLDPEFRPVLEGLNHTVEAFERPFRLTAEHLVRLSRGDLPPPITERFSGDFDRTADALNRCIGAIGALVADTRALAAAGVEGRLSQRVDPARHEGEYRRVVEGVNATLDAVLGPLGAAAGAVEAIARGDIPAPITGEFRGEFDVLKRNLNTCIASLQALVQDAHLLADAAVRGELGTRVDPARHPGDFGRIVAGVNATLDAVTGPLASAAGLVDRLARGEIPPPVAEAWAGDFARLRDNLNTCFAAVNRLVEDAHALAEAAVRGRLSERADPARHRGEFRSVVEGVNATLDALAAPVAGARAALERLAARDLGARVAGDFCGDHARLTEAVNRTASALEQALLQVTRTVDHVSSAANQIAASSQAVASGATEQAASLDRTGASLEAVASTATKAADDARQASQLAGSARRAAQDGTGAVEELQAVMARIRESSEGTGQIIKDVSEIAFQTNLLALNAAVEAARAGDAGRGFAVVAEEVRALALRAKEAAAKTEQLILASVRETAAGETAARQVAGRLGEIVDEVSKVTELVTEISAAAVEQARGVGGVSSAVGEIDRVTQQNAASAEESSAAAAELSSRAAELADLLADFRLEREGAEAPAPGSLRRAG